MAAPLDIDRVKAALVIGVTGHRDLRDEDREPLKNSVRDVLMELRQQYPSTPFILLSPLADGADRLVAEVALLPEIGARLVVPLPMPKEMYEADFDSDSLDKFNKLLQQADQWFELPLVAGRAAVSRQGPERDLQYEAVGKYIARESQILLALWDGVQLDKVGGTAAIVKFQTEGLPDPQTCNLLPPELFPVYHIVTPRVSNPSPQAPFQMRVIYPPAFGSDEAAKEYYEKTFGNLDEFNRLAADYGPAPKNAGGNFSQGETWTRNRYAIADALALKFQKRMRLTDSALHWLVFLSFSSFVFYAHCPEHPWPALGMALVLLALGYALHYVAKRKGLDDKRLDYRAVAEGCRVRLYWHLAGVSDSVPDNYLGKQRTELDWIRNGLRGWGIGLEHYPPTKERTQSVLNDWVTGQRNYFKTKIEESEKKSEFMERCVTICLWLAIAIGGGLFVASLIMPEHEGKEAHEPLWLVASIISIDLFLAGAALLHHANERMAHSEHLKQYGRMLNIFDNALKSIQGLLDSGNVAAASSCLRALGREALVENGDWVLLHRERPLEIPHPLRYRVTQR